MIEHLFYPIHQRPAFCPVKRRRARPALEITPEIGPSRAQPNDPIVRLMPVITDPAPRPGRRVALDLVLRALAIAFVTLLILGLLPAIAEAAG